MSSWGGAIYEIVSGAQRKRPASRRCWNDFHDSAWDRIREIMRTVARLVEEKRLRAVIDSEWRLQESKEAIERQRVGDARGRW